MPSTTLRKAVPDARAAYFAWRGYVRKRDSTDLDILDHPLVREAWATAWERGVKTRLALESEFAGAIDVNRRVADLLEQLAYEREAMQQALADTDAGKEE